MSKMKINKLIDINKLKVGDEIESYRDSTFCVYDNFEINISICPWEYWITYVDSDYIIVNLIKYPSASPYLLGNCKYIERLKL
jgi:hypothetical protein